MSEESPQKRDDMWMMEEYKALRAEILANEDYQKNLLIFGSSVLAAAFGFIYRDAALADYRCVLLLLTQILAIGFWYAFERLSVSTEEIGTYIVCHMERHTALNWETFQRVRMNLPTTKATESPTEASPSTDLGESRRAPKEKQKEKHKKDWKRRLLNACGQLPFLIFIVVSLILIVVESHPKWELKNMIPAILSAFLFILMLVAFIVHEFSLKSTAKLVDMTDRCLKASLDHRTARNLHHPAGSQISRSPIASGNGTTNKAVNPSGGSGVSK